ncbi:nuclease-related domain-containing protein [Bacillus sp. T33-2]|uniref:nuclease-related domain-containing protein n=1 Tax=Bacillus sp. T33-2 TaxID=2054168 RepID=UPI000C779614|nr:nuclease-related domain-containing protein [Bacillus sp. T33-2]PLR94596.1 hypothetical protein CVD19_16620 [Bacillus sp. T33-2]
MIRLSISENPFIEDGIFYYKDKRTKRAINKGNKGELMVHNELLKIEQIDDYNVLLNLNLIVSNQDYKPTQIDHLVISKYGLFVIETKNYSGIIEGHVYNEYWDVIYKSSVHKLFNPIIQNSTHLYAIKAKVLVVVDESYFINKLPDGNLDFYSGIYSIIVFTGNAKLNIKGQHKEMVLYLPDLLNCVLSHRKEHFTEKQVSTIVNKIIEEDIEVETVPG